MIRKRKLPPKSLDQRKTNVESFPQSAMAPRPTAIKSTIAVLFTAGLVLSAARPIGEEHALRRHLSDGEEFTVSPHLLIDWGKRIFEANWTGQDGAGRPLTKGTGHSLSDPTAPLKGMRAFNRVSGPDANSCMGCHNMPYGIPGGAGDFAAGVFVLGQRFDFVTFDRSDTVPTRGSMNERQQPVSLQNVGNFRRSPGMFGAGYIEMLAREITADLRSIRDSIEPGQTKALSSKGIDFGRLTRNRNGSWDTSEVIGLPAESLLSSPPINPMDPPSLVIRPWHQAGAVVSLREFSNNAFNQHHGMQSTERFGRDTDPDGDGVTNELTRADMTAVVMYQAVMAVPGRVIPDDPELEKAIAVGEQVFEKIGCAGCHIPNLPLRRQSWFYSEPNPYNPPGNLRTGEIRGLKLSLLDPHLPQPRLMPQSKNADVIQVPVYTDFRLHNICGPSDCGDDSIDQNQPPWSPKFRQPNSRFLTTRLWGVANQPPFFHHGLFTTLREAVLSHHGEAESSRAAFLRASDYERDSVIEFLKTLQVLPPRTTSLIVNERFQKKTWPRQPSRAGHGLPKKRARGAKIPTAPGA